jgi:hypothetical protein
MRTCQWEGRIIVIESNLLPAARGMAGGTDRSKLPLVYISGGMTREAILWRALIHIVHMAGLAGNVAVQTGQWERRVVVIEYHLTPFGGLVTGAAIRAKLPTMHITRRMTGKTVFRRALIHAVYMAGFAYHCGVGTGQGKGSFAMIKGNVFPAPGGMTGGAFGAKLTLMDILRRMAGEAVLRRAFVDIVYVTGFTGNIGVQAIKRKGGLGVVENHL